MKHNRYDESFKTEAVDLAQVSYAEVARGFSINYGTLTNWIYTAMSNPKPPSKVNKSKASKP